MNLLVAFDSVLINFLALGFFPCIAFLFIIASYSLSLESKQHQILKRFERTDRLRQKGRIDTIIGKPWEVTLTRRRIIHMSTSAENTNSGIHPGPGLERIIFFSDAVIAIAVTLLAVDIKPPEVDPSQLASALSEFTPRFGSFALSFLIIASFWIGHHITFSYIRTYDYKLTWLNVLFLLFIALTPFASSMLGMYQFNITALIVYSTVLAMAGFFRASIWEYAARGHRLVDSDLSQDLIKKMSIRNFIAPVTFTISGPLILINVAFVAVWIVVPISIVAYRKIPKGR